MPGLGALVHHQRERLQILVRRPARLGVVRFGGFLALVAP